MRVINKDRIIEAYVKEPYKNSGEQWDYKPTHDWQVILVVGFLAEGHERQIIIEKKSKKECVALINSFGFVSV